MGSLIELLNTWIGLAVWVRQKKRTHPFFLCDYGGPRLDGLDETGGLDRSGGPGREKGHTEDPPVCPLQLWLPKTCWPGWSGGPGHVEEENLPACPL